MNIITKDPMNYKTYLKKSEIITIKIRIIKHIIIDKMLIKDVAFLYSMHRNSVTNIMNIYYSSSPPKLKYLIENNFNLSSNDINKLCDFLLPKSRKPLSNSKQANTFEEQKILN
jgi:hypothetical protein